MRDSYAKIPIKEMDKKTRSKVFAETSRLEYIMKMFGKRLDKATDESSCFKLKFLLAKELLEYYNKNLTTKETRIKLTKPDYLFIYKDEQLAANDELLEVLNSKIYDTKHEEVVLNQLR